MKFTKINRLSIALLCIFFSSAHSMESLLIYESLVPIVDIFQTIRHGLHFLILAPLRHKYPNIHTHIIQQRLAAIKKNIRTDEKNAIKALVKKYGISDASLQECMSVIKQYKEYQRVYMTSAHDDVVHDTTFPQDIIIPLLQQNNIHPHSINLIDSKKPSTHNANTTMIHTAGAARGNNITITKIINPPTITIHPLFHILDSPKGTLIHEIEHIKQGHGITKNCVAEYISFATGTKRKTIRNSISYRQIISTYERQADILPSLRNAKYAHIMRKHRSENYYPGHLFIKHYAQLAEIDELHKLCHKLEQFKPAPIEKIDDLRVMKKSIDYPIHYPINNRGSINTFIFE